jgi:dipeptidase D
MEPVVVHAGIECGCFLQQVPSLDAIAIGPDCQFMHAPTERLNVASTQRSWRLLTTLLQELASV